MALFCGPDQPPCPPGWTCSEWGECEPDSGGTGWEGGEDPRLDGCTDPSASNYNPNAEFDDGSCDYGTDYDDATDPDPSESGCTPGTMYYDWEGNLKYCQTGGSGLYGDPLGEWRSGGGWTTEGLPEGLSNITSDQRNIFDVLPPEVLQHVPPQYWGDIGGSYAGLEERPAWESFLSNIRGLQSGTKAERRNLQEGLRGMNLGGGVSQTFAGGGGGVLPGREKAGAMRTFRDFLGEQATEKAGYELGFEEEATGFREQWEEDIQTGYANVLSGDPTHYCTTCDEGEICMGKLEDPATGELTLDNCVPEGEVNWSDIQNTWLG